ncbi:hypothetical protein GM3709_2877 [Geminocystis sp. NIES-3709]|nr:hypothetical protein GM3709_2877 [Geminocystis sp. NIES-3709]
MITKPQTPIANTQEENLSPEAILRKEMKGYELVLAKEPDNVFALEKLVEIHLQLRNLSTALPLVEKLVTIQPDNQRYQEVLKIIKQGLAQEKTKTPPPPNSSNIPDNNEKK